MDGNKKNQVKSFWKWFSDNSENFGESFENDELLEMLDEKISELGNFAWEVGPGKKKPNMLVISPGGDEELLEETKKVVSMADLLPSWEFYGSKQIKDWDYRFDFMLDDESTIDVDASQWNYLLLHYDDGKLGVVFETGDDFPLKTLNENEEVSIAEILLDGCIGEEERILNFVYHELIKKVDKEDIVKERKISTLSESYQMVKEK